MPTFTIKDPDTGRVIRMTGDRPPAESDIKAAFANEPQQQQSQTPFQDMSGAMQQNPLMQAANFLTAGGLGMNMGVAANQADYMKNQPNATGNLPQAFKNTVDATGHFATQLPQAALGDVLTVLGLRGTRGVVNSGINIAKATPGAIKALPSAGKYMTQKGLIDMSTAAKDVSVARGEFQTEQDFNNAIADELEGRDPHGLATDLRKAVQDRLNKLPGLQTVGTTHPIQAGDTSEGFIVGPKGPSETTSAQFTEGKSGFTGPEPRKLTADWFHSLRKTLDKEIDWARRGNSPIDEDAAKVIRKVASDQLHKMAPETKTLDKIYKIYSNPIIKGGKVPMINLNMKYPQAIAGVPSAAINALLGAELGKKLFGK